MSYSTQASHELVDHLHCQEVTYTERAQKADTAHDRGLWMGMLIATRTYREFCESHLEKIEAEARLVPDTDEPDVMTYAARIVDDLFPTQSGEFRSFFDLDAA